ncbi:MAG: hypothetical protein ACK4UT_01260 [Moraxellaceae bacterium]
MLPALAAHALPLAPEKTPDAAVVVAVFAEATGMQAMADEDMSDVQAQAGSLILMDRIGPNELTGATSAGTYANFTYYRMGLDAKLDLNANISKLQLGCGGVNDFLTGARGCDLDIDYVGFMGLNAAGDRPGAPGSPFQLKRPFVEIAVKNANDPIKREVVGFRLGAQNINGAIRMGRDYTNFGYPDYTTANTNIPNLENGDTCNPSATTGANVVGCHSGLNSISGYLAGLEISAGFQARATICDILLLCVWPFYPSISLNIDGCLGRINFDPCTTSDTPFFIDAGGTRITSLNVAAAKLKLETSVIIPITLEGYGRLDLNTRHIHYLLTPNSPGFFLSFQRERVSWPNYEKAPPPNNLPFDSCNPAYGQTTARCSSAYSPTANTGWWLSANNTKMLNLRPGNRIVLPNSLTLGQLISALGPDTSPLVIDNPKLDFIAADNCYGTARFC